MKSIQKNKTSISLLILWVKLLVPVMAQNPPPFKIIEQKQGIEISENNCPVIFYRLEPNSPDGISFYNNYIHPLISPGGDTLTEEFPTDHPYHRGIFWAWHQVFINNQSVGDGWIMQYLVMKLNHVNTIQTDSTLLVESDWNWSSTIWKNRKPFIQEHTKIQIYHLQESVRIIDFEISLTALTNHVSIGGSNDEKGYGGFCARLKLPEDLTFTSVNGPVIPQVTQINAGSWMDFSGTFGMKDRKSGITILGHPGNMNFPAPWILRQTTSMQNIVFPGKIRIAINKRYPLKIKYRMLIHKGDVKELDILKYQESYDTSHF